MEVNGERIHHHHFGRQRTHKSRRRPRKQLDVGHPRLRTMEVAFDGEVLPQLQIALDIFTDGFGLQTERMAGEIHPLAITRSARNVKAFAVGRERIPTIQFLREISCRFQSSRFETARHHPSLL